MYLLLDANVVAGYYLPRTLDSAKAQDRIPIIVDSVRSKASDHFLYIPNFCIAEVFSVFAKHAFGRWNSHVKKKGGTVDKRVYESVCRQFKTDIHNANIFYHLELSRYHVLAADLVAPVDHHFRFNRGDKRVVPAGTFDQLIVAMGIHLAHVHGSENVCIVTSDTRLANLVIKCRRYIPASTIERLKLSRAEEIAGKPFGASLFPRVLNLGQCTKSKLEECLGAWPLPVARHKKPYRWFR